ncbi:MAG: DUF6259 domain-containing protein [Candidatus Marinimicrobia bacterium]|nr:DUF6259 domain-containing protein [Candidatus Neomarinimicrobiota bacterium]
MNTRILRNDKIKIVFGQDPLEILQIIDLQEDQILCKSGKQRLLLRLPEEVSDPILLSRAEWSEFDENYCSFHCWDKDNLYDVKITLRITDVGLYFQTHWKGPKPIWLVEWQLGHLKLENVIIPALGGQQLSSNMPAGSELSYKYPFWWNAQFVIGESDDNSGLWLYSHDPEPNLKLLRVGKESEGYALTYGYEAQAPLDSEDIKCDWFIETFHNGWEKVVDEYQNWMESAFSLQPLSGRSNVPEWTDHINFILEVWGANRRSDKPYHTYQEIQQRIKEWGKLHSPEETLLYLPGFAENGIDSHAPSYNPSPQMGGPEEFKKMIETAHQLGYKVMIHTNVLAMTFSHPRYQEFQKYQVKDPFGREVAWGLDMDGDWITEPYFAYINPGVSRWSELMVDILGQLIEKYNIDGIFLDQTLLAFNNSNGPNFINGMRKHVERLQQAFPEILFAGEGLHEHITKPFSMAQIHGIDSISNVHGIEGKQPWRHVHPVSTYLFGKFTRFTAHLLTKHPTSSEFTRQESAYEQLNIIPALCLYNSSQQMDLPETKVMIERAKKLNRGE